MRLFRAIRTNIKTQGFGRENTFPALLAKYESFGLRGHNGWDWAAITGEPIFWDSDRPGLVLETTIDSSGGLGVEVLSEEERKYWKHRFWHLKEFRCKPGDHLQPGDLIGLADNTGFSTGPHLHRDIKECDEYSNTLNWFNGYLGAIDITPYYRSIFVKDYISTLPKQVSVLSQAIEVVKKLIALLKGHN